MQHEGRLVAENSQSLRPQPEDCEVFVIRRRKMKDAQDPSLNALKAAVANVVLDELRRVSGVHCLLLRHVPRLRGK